MTGQVGSASRRERRILSYEITDHVTDQADLAQVDQIGLFVNHWPLWP